jgi:glycolate oxidase
MDSYRKLGSEDFDFFRSVAGDKRVFVGDDINKDFSHDEMAGVHKMPEAVVEVLATEEVSKIMKYANDTKIPVVVRGCGTGLVGGSVAIHGGVMLSMAQMKKIVELDKDNLTLTVEPGLTLQEIIDFLTPRDFMYPPDPGEKNGAIGGNINTNAGGMRAVKYGVTRDYIRGLEVVLPDGKVLELGEKKAVKNSSGYSLKNLVIGSEGTLAVVTKAVLKIVPLPKIVVSLLIPFSDLESAIETVPKIVRSKALPTSIEYMEREVILDSEKFLEKKFPDNSADSYLLLTFDGSDKESVERDYEAVAEICLENGALDVLVIDTPDRKEAIWNTRGSFLEAIRNSTTAMDECDVCVPRDRIADFIKYTHEVRVKSGVRIKTFGHAGDGNLHSYILKDEMTEEEWEKKAGEIFDLLYRKAEELEGQVSGEHGIGYVKREYFHRQLGEDVIGLMRGIKSVFDPNNILNPGKVI